VIRGLNDRYTALGLHLRRARPFPTFDDVCADLLMEELNLANRSSTSSTALVASTAGQHASGSTSSSGGAPRTPSGGGSSSGGAGSGKPSKEKKGGRGRRGGRAQQKTTPPTGTSAANGGSSSGTGGPGASGTPGGAPWPSLYNPWAGTIQMYPGPRPPVAPQQPVRPGPQQAFVAQPAFAPLGLPPGFFGYPAAQVPQGATWAATPPQTQYSPLSGTPSWDQQSLASTFSTMTLNQPQNNEWFFDTGASSHMTPDPHTLSHTSYPTSSLPASIIVGDGSLIPVTSSGGAHFPGPLHLNNVLVSPKLIKNLISVRQFTIDNNCSVEFDPSGCSVKDLKSRNVIIRCNSSGPLYPLQLPAAQSLVAVSTPTLWHRRLGHPGHEALSKLALPGCTRTTSSSLCHACQLGRHVRLPFRVSSSRASHKFDLIHCDLWTSPVASVSGFKYYLVVLDDYSHFGRFPCGSNLTLSLHCLTFSLM